MSLAFQRFGKSVATLFLTSTEVPRFDMLGSVTQSLWCLTEKGAEPSKGTTSPNQATPSPLPLPHQLTLGEHRDR